MVWVYLAALGLGLHGLIHFLGFAATWRLAEISGVAAAPSLLPGLVAGSLPVLALGAVWLLAGVAFLAAGVGLAADAAWWTTVAAGAAVVSLALCLAWWTDAKAGAFVDLGILVALVAVTRLAQPSTA